MTNHSNEHPQAFDSSRIDEELEALTSTDQVDQDWSGSQDSKRRLLNDLDQVYATSTRQRENDLEEVWRRVASSTSYARYLRDQSSMRKEVNMRQETFIDNNNTFVSPPNKNKQPAHTRRRQRWLAILGPLAAILVVAVLVGSAVLIFNQESKNNMAHKPTNTVSSQPQPTSTPVVNSSGIYLTYPSTPGKYMVAKVDMKTHKPLWTYQRADLSDVDAPTIYEDTAYMEAFNDTAGQSHLIALNATTGKERWDVPLKVRIEGNGKDGTLVNLSIITTPVVSNGQVFVINRAGTVFAFDSETGKQNWTYDTGASVYVQTYFKNPDTGKMQSTGSPTRYNSITPTVSDGILYSVQRDTVYALDTRNGHKIWTYRITSGQQIFEDAQVVDGVVYAASNALSTHQDPQTYQSTIYALDAKNGNLSWNHELNGYDLLPLAIDNGHIYFIKYNTSYQGALAALNQQGHELWTHAYNNTNIYWLTAGNGYVSISGFNHDQSNVTNNQGNLITNTLYVLGADGHPVWQNNSGADGMSIKNGVLYAVHGLWLIAYDLKTQKELWRGQYGIDILDRAGNHTAHLGFMNVVP